MPASAHFASCSPPPALPGVPEMPIAPTTFLPATIGTPPAAVVMFGSSTGPMPRSSVKRLPYSAGRHPVGERRVRLAEGMRFRVRRSAVIAHADLLPAGVVDHRNGDLLSILSALGERGGRNVERRVGRKRCFIQQVLRPRRNGANNQHK